MNNTLTLLSSAKVNLMLNVLCKREDGYHEIESIMTRISIFDEVSIRIDDGEGLEVRCIGPAPSGERNIAYKAALEILKRYPNKIKVKVHIKKNIPVAAGLGGGSSNAATVLLGLNNMLGTGLSRDELIKIGAKLGADVPFFVFEKPAIARGIGELLEEVALSKLWFVLLNPNIPVSTADVYRGLNLKIGLTKERFDISIINFNIGIEGVARILHNDLEDVALMMHPEIGFVKEELLSAGALKALMSGSGATVFGLFANKEKAEDAFDHLSSRHKDWRIFIAESI